MRSENIGSREAADSAHLSFHDPARVEEPCFSSRHVRRWYRGSGKRIIHADVNGSYNTGRKVVPAAL